MVRLLEFLLCYFHHCNLENINDINWVDNTSITMVDYKNDLFDVVLEGESSHLEQYENLGKSGLVVGKNFRN